LSGTKATLLKNIYLLRPRILPGAFFSSAKKIFGVASAKGFVFPLQDVGSLYSHNS
jgi:hypothetical protein